MIRDWAKWCINHKMRWILLTLVVCSYPVYLWYNMVDAFKQSNRDFKYDYEAIKNYESKT